MKVRALFACLLALSASAQQQWETALPNYRFQFPLDHFDHPRYQTEWWYYTGNLQGEDGHRFGFELTFFRQAGTNAGQTVTTEVWRPNQFYLAHFALSDLTGGQFLHRERLNRAGPGLAGANEREARYWNGNWQVRWLQPLDGHQDLRAVIEGTDIHLDLRPGKQPVIHGRNGVSRKGPEPGEASHYISFTRLSASGELHFKNKLFRVTGTAWMDHEFFSEPPDNALIGWDWFAIQLDNNRELMLYRLRRKSGDNQFSSGTFVDADGHTELLDASDFSLQPQEQWRSPDSGQTYPVGWTISVPKLRLQLREQTALKNQELFSRDPVSPVYWEGAVTYAGTMKSEEVKGVGYLEMTGYAGAMHLGGTGTQ